MKKLSIRKHHNSIQQKPKSGVLKKNSFLNNNFSSRSSFSTINHQSKTVKQSFLKQETFISSQKKLGQKFTHSFFPRKSAFISSKYFHSSSFQKNDNNNNYSLNNNNNNSFKISNILKDSSLKLLSQSTKRNQTAVFSTQLFKNNTSSNLVFNQTRNIGWTDWESDLKDWEGPEIPIPADHRDFETISKRWEIREMLELRRHCNTTAAGRIYSYSCLVFVGNRKGSAGLGYGKGLDPPKATENAFRNACKNILSLRTNQIHRPIYAKFVSSKVLLRPKTWGNMGGYIMDILMSAFGLENVHLKTFGNRNRKNIYKAIFFALSRSMYQPSEQAKHLGKKYVDMRKVWLGRPEYNREKKIYEYLSKREDYQ